MRFPLESTAVQWVWDSQQALIKHSLRRVSGKGQGKANGSKKNSGTQLDHWMK